MRTIAWRLAGKGDEREDGGVEALGHRVVEKGLQLLGKIGTNHGDVL